MQYDDMQRGGQINQAAQHQIVKTHINTEDLKEIINNLNKKPFNENFSLATFDELSSYIINIYIYILIHYCLLNMHNLIISF